MNEVKVGDIRIGKGNPMALIAGPCVIEGEAIVMEIAKQLKELCKEMRIPLIFKASYEKDNRGSEKSYQGPGLKEGLKILAKVKEKTGLPVLSDVHRVEDVDQAKEVLDVIQIPAFLCQQTSLLLKAGETGRVVNIKKGQFVAPENMAGAVKKIHSTGNRQVLLTERGTCFGYNKLISDFCSIPIMQGIGCPVIFDATHVVRNYGIPSEDPRGGSPQYVPHLSRAAMAVGCNGLFLETHPRPGEALCDASSMIPLHEMEWLLRQTRAIHDLVREWEIS
ncbi:MAG: 3-deoxy-8-phosphooctulonate synthase [Deltaproteobacteria bacterium RBG_16_49_23]|nr:MAG: 3-deoxy-8-phosphooctulonate synthase [Deltaproteobacteria bacterium RBG_16_49_23]